METYQIIICLCAVGTLFFSVFSFLVASNRSINKKIGELEIAVRVLEALMAERKKD